jgi:hypothetical protein
MTGKIRRECLLGACCVGLLLGTAALTWAPTVWGQGASPALQVEQVQPRSMDRSREGKRKGVLTRVKEGTVWIDGTAYTLAADALVENRTGGSLQANALRWDDVQYSVDYWLVPDSADRQIAQMVIYFPE